MEPTLLDLARACLTNMAGITSEAIRDAVHGLSPEVLAELAEYGGPRPDRN